MNPDLERLHPYPFEKLGTLFADLPASDKSPVAFSIGEPQHPAPDFVQQALRDNTALLAKYPGTAGLPELREAIAGWLTRRFKLQQVSSDHQVLPVNGTREALFNIAQIATPTEKAGKRPAILMPNPFYQCYAAAALAAGAEPVYIAATRETGFMPDFEALPDELLARTAMIYFCSPANPQGAVADMDYLKRLIVLARRHDITLAIDECYADIYDREAPAGALEAALALEDEGEGEKGGTSDPFANIIVFHSLSKRSSLPGLRSGFCAGERALMQRFRGFRNIAAPQVPLPLMAAAAACWNDDAHASANRDLYRAKIDAAERVFGNRSGFYRPPGGFFLWLDVGDGEAAARELWAKAGVKVLPGAYLSREDSPYGPGGNPGKAYIRVALVDGESETEEALARMAEVL